MNRRQQSEKRHRTSNPREAGQSLVFMAFLIVALLGFLVLVTDVGYMYYTKRDLQGIVDAAVMAGARRTPAPVDTSTEKRTKIDETIREALGCYARNIGLNASSVPGGPYTLTPGWDGGSGSNYQHTATIGGDEVSVTVFYEDAVTQQRELAKELCVRVDTRRNTSMFFAGVLGFPNVDMTAAAAGWRGIFRVTWTFRTKADVHATPVYYVDPHAGNREVVLIGVRDGYFYCLDAQGYQDGSKKTWAYWRYKPNRAPYSSSFGDRTRSDNVGGTTQTGPLDEWDWYRNDANGSTNLISSAKVLDTGSRSLLFFTTCDLSDNSRYGALYCLDASTGQRLWSRDIRNPKYHRNAHYTGDDGLVASFVDSGPSFSSDNSVVYVGSRGGYLYAFNVADGSYVPNASGGWQNGRVQLAGGIVSTPFVESTPQGDVIYISCLTREVSSMGSGGNGRVYAFDSDGTVKWHWTPGGMGFKGFNGSPVVLGNTLYVGCLNKKFYALNKETGAVKWQFTADNAVSATSVVEQASDGYTYVYFSDDKAEAYKLRDLGTTCSEVWQATLGLKDPTRPDPGAWHISPALATDYVYFGCQTKYGYQYMQGGRGYFEALQKATGQSDQQYKMEADLHSSMRVGVNNWLYFGSCENLICGVDLNPAKQESKLLW